MVILEETATEAIAPLVETAIHRVFLLPNIYIPQIIPSFLGWQLHQCKAIIA
ncbi:hypothetical protein [Nostoc sp. CALU 1950]|uniref:hypothetical protein n=1 Tax=Nostoc sp. CALU 1950 TaxID=3104321 RepID=UPI003EC04D3B